MQGLCRDGFATIGFHLQQMNIRDNEDRNTSKRRVLRLEYTLRYNLSFLYSFRPVFLPIFNDDITYVEDAKRKIRND
jgi:hypothetical protein